MTTDKTGRIIWHDLFTQDLKRSMAFYEQVAGWSFQIEHATDFAWGGGEKDFVLALLEGEAGAGLIETPPEAPDGWIAYIEVPDVDATTVLAEKLGGTIVRAPFEVPGVGRNALLRDPLGALFGVSLSRHSFPAPTRQFGIEAYLSGAEEFPGAFYEQLFSWKVDMASSDGAYVIAPSGEAAAEIWADDPAAGSTTIWMPGLKIADFNASLKSAEEADAELLIKRAEQPGRPDRIILCDPMGALACLPPPIC